MKMSCQLSLSLIILLLSQWTFAQTKPVVLSNFVSPFAHKQNTGTRQIIRSSVQRQPKVNHGNDYFSIRKREDYSMIRFTDKSKMASGDFFKSFAEELGLSKSDHFNLVKTEDDAIGFRHERYQQLYNGIPVMGGEYLLHEKNGKLTSANGNIYNGLSMNTTPAISKESAIQKAIDFTGAQKYKWQNPAAEQFLKSETNNPDATYYPKPEIIIAPVNGIFTKENFRLCYRVCIASEIPYDISDVFVDAQTGAIRNKISKIASSDVTGIASTLYSGSKTITMDSSGSNYSLREANRPIQTFNMNNGTNYLNAVDFTNATTNWNTQDISVDSVTISTLNTNWEDFLGEQILNGDAPDVYIEIRDAGNNLAFRSTVFNNTFPPFTINTGGFLLSNGTYTLTIYDDDAALGSDLLGNFSFTAVPGTNSFSGSGTSGSILASARNNPALDVHWAMEIAYDFYLNQLSRNSFDNIGGLIKNYVHLNSGLNNAYWDGTAMSYGDGDGTILSPLVSLDVVGHEFTHAVVQYTAGLVYQGESGGLNESFADIFGTAIEFYGVSLPNWTIGEDIVLFPPNYMRSMSDPNSAPGQFGQQPDTYEGDYWIDPGSALDNGGVHTNSGVQNFWFYLLSQGGSGTNDVNDAYSVTGIGINAATQIAYRNLAVYLTSTSGYLNSLDGSLQAAEDLYGANSMEQNAVRAAWYAVGIGNSPGGQCSGSYLTAGAGSFSDGSGSANYQDTLDCYWLIEPAGADSIILTFTSFDTEAGFDSVIVYDGRTTSSPILMTWSGNTVPPPVTSSTGSLLVNFMSDSIQNYSGWSADYASYGTSWCSGGTLLTASTGAFTDGSGANSYGNNSLCYWLIAPPCANSITLSFSGFDTESGYDGIIVYDDAIGSTVLLNASGTVIPTPITSTGGEMLVVFFSDFSNNMAGFSASYTSTGTPYCSGTTVINNTDADVISDGSSTNDYCNNMDCSWLIQPPLATSITFNFTDFDVEAASTDGLAVYDAVEIYDGSNTSAPLLGRFFGNALPPSVTSTGGSMYIRFYSDISVTQGGWSGYFTSATTNYCAGSSLLTTPAGLFSDGSGTNLYGNGADCNWLIQPANVSSITLTFTSFATELNYDGVIVYDGADTSASQLGVFTGSSIPSSVTSTGGSMFVWFISDGSVRDSGWNISYTSVIAGVNMIEQNNNISVYPNPFTNKLTVEFNLEKESKADITVTNALGQAVAQYSSMKTAGNSKQLIDLAELPGNIYWIKIRLNNEQRVFKAIKLE